MTISENPRRARDRPINRPVDLNDPTWIIHIDGPGGSAPGGPMFLDQREATECNTDPDLFAAKHLGFATSRRISRVGHD
jgi:hypothetical protein